MDSQTSLPVATVVVCSRDRAEQLLEALPFVIASLRAGDELIVVDSASQDDATAAAAAQFGVRCVRVDRPGLSRARNAGVRAASHDLVLFTDDDCRPDPDWVSVMAAAFAADPGLGFVTGQVAALDAGAGLASVTRNLEPRTYAGAVDPGEIGHGANMAYRRSALLDIGLFDEVLGAGGRLRSGEDKDAFLRCLAAGLRGRFEPAAVVRHVQWRDHRELIRLRYGYGLGNGAIRAKAVRRQPREGLRLLLDGLWSEGFVGVYWAVRRLRRTAPSAFTHLAGYLVGIVKGLTYRLDGPSFVEPERRR